MPAVGDRGGGRVRGLWEFVCRLKKDVIRVRKKSSSWRRN
jgi:hypothetical protein